MGRLWTAGTDAAGTSDRIVIGLRVSALRGATLPRCWTQAGRSRRSNRQRHRAGDGAHSEPPQSIDPSAVHQRDPTDLCRSRHTGHAAHSYGTDRTLDRCASQPTGQLVEPPRERKLQRDDLAAPVARRTNRPARAGTYRQAQRNRSVAAARWDRTLDTPQPALENRPRRRTNDRPALARS